MTNPHQSMGDPADAQPVRPGTSDALTARTIDATAHPPLVRARESVVGFVPRIAHAAEPLTSPVLLGAVALTLVFVWVAKRNRYRPGALLLSGLLVATLTSFHPFVRPEPARIAQSRIPRTLTRGARTIPTYYPEPGQSDERARVVAEPPSRSREVESPDGWREPGMFVLPRIPIERIPEMSAEMMRSAEQMMRDNEQVQEMAERLRHRLRDEVRHRRWRRHYGIGLAR